MIKDFKKSSIEKCENVEYLRPCKKIFQLLP